MPSAATSTAPHPDPGAAQRQDAGDDAVHVMHLKDGKATESWVMSKDQGRDGRFWS